jgi:uncharacterized protein with ParB-like and HNH nuclease domain
MSRISETYTYEPNSVEDLFAKSLYDIPAYQRGYAWEADTQVKTLLDDLRRGIEEDTNSLYFLGEVTVVRRNQTENIPTYEVIDGQQRLTTLQLILMCLHKQIESFDTAAVNDAVDQTETRREFLTVPLTISHGKKDKLRFRVQPAVDGLDALIWAHEGKLRDSLNLKTATPAIKTQSQLRVVEAWQFIDDYLVKNFPSAQEKLLFLSFVLNQTVIVRLCVTRAELALDIFWKANGRGMPLTDADLLKNMLFINSTEDQFHAIEKHWKEAATQLFSNKKGRKDSMLPFLKTWSQILTGKNIGQNKVFDTWNQILQDGPNAKFPDSIDASIEPQILASGKNSSQRTLEFATVLPERARQATNIASNLSPSGSLDLTELCIGSSQMKIHQHSEVLFAAKHFSDASYKTLVDFVENRTMLYQLSGERTQDFERLLHPWSNSIAKLNPTATRKEILEASSMAVENLDFLIESMKTKMGNLNYSTNSHRKMIRYAIARATAYSQFQMYNENGNIHSFIKDLITPSTNISGKTSVENEVLVVQLDHIFPKSEAKSPIFESRLATWLDSLSPESNPPEVIAKFRNFNFVNSIGNLALLKSAENLEQQDDLPEAPRKISHYCGKSQKYLLNVSISSEGVSDNASDSWRNTVNKLREINSTELSNWTPQSIIDRANLYLALLERDFRNKLT